MLLKSRTMPRHSNKELEKLTDRAITYKVLCGIVKYYEEATFIEIRTKYGRVSELWNLPIKWLSEESIYAYLNQGIKNGVLKYERRQKGKIIERRVSGQITNVMGYYTWIKND